MVAEPGDLVPMRVVNVKRRHDPADVVRQLIHALTVGRAELAEKIGVSPATLQSWAVGRRTPRPDNVRRLARAATLQSRRVARLTAELLRSIEDDA